MEKFKNQQYIDAVISGVENDDSLDAVKVWLGIGCTIRFWYKNLLYSMERGDDESWYMWANDSTRSSNPIFDTEFNTLDDLYSYEFEPGKTFDDVYSPDNLENIE